MGNKAKKKTKKKTDRQKKTKNKRHVLYNVGSSFKSNL